MPLAAFSLNSPFFIGWAPLYFVSFIIIINHLIINIFILAILERFEKLYKNPEGPVWVFQNELPNFQVTWEKFAYEKDKNYIELRKLQKFFRNYNSILGKLALQSPPH